MAMQIRLCKKSVNRLGADAAELMEQLHTREHAVELKDCLQRCQACDLGLIIAQADGMPLSGKTIEKILGSVDELAAHDAED